MNFETPDTWAAAIAAIFGGIGVTILEKLINRDSQKFSEIAKLKEESRLERESLTAESLKYKAEADEWRDKYYVQAEELLKLQRELEELQLDLHRLQTDSPPSDKE